MRLTDKFDDGYYNGYYTTEEMSSGIAYYDDKKFTNAAIEKLGELEDIEDELGIDLVTLFKALKDGVYYRDPRDNEIHLNYPHLSSYHNLIVNMELILKIKDYGETWALTKEELK